MLIRYNRICNTYIRGGTELKKVMLICLLFIIVLMSACTDDSSVVSGDSAADQNEEKAGNGADKESKKEDLEKKKEEANKKKESEEEKAAASVAKNPEPRYTINQKTWSVEPLNESVNEKVVLLTFDDAPDNYAVGMAKTIKKLDADAIFFVNGIYLESPEGKRALKKIHDMGFLIGNHTYSHAYLPDLSKEEQRKEIEKVSEMVEEIIGEKPKFFRAPNGANTDFTKKVADEQGMTLMNWSYGYDWHEEYSSKAAITDIMLHTDLLGSGSNLLMHDREWTSKALPDIVSGLRDQGYEIVDPHLIKTK